MYEFLKETVLPNMAHRAKTVAPEMTVGDLLRLFKVDGSDAYPVVSGETLVGIVSKADAFKAFALTPDNVVPRYDDKMGTTVAEVMSHEVITVDTATNLQRVLHLMVTHHFNSLPVIDGKNRLKGIITRDDLIEVLVRCADHATLPLTPPAVGYYAIL
jgi:CBS domain-containing protein